MRILLLAVLVSASLPAAVTFHKEVAPILQKRCQACHRPGEAAPMSLLTYRDARPWAKAMREAVLTRRMPPWFADAPRGHFINDLSLTGAEIKTIAAWADAGAPEGNPKDAPPPAPFLEGWNIGPPHAVFELPKPYAVPASGTIDYQHVVVPTGFREDKWVQLAEVRPGDRSVVHHVIAYIREPGSRWLREAKVGEPVGQAGPPVLPGEILTGYAPGLPPTFLPDGQAILVKAGSDLVIQMHYTANGKPAVDRTKVGIVFAKKPVAERVTVMAAYNQDFTIPPGAPNHRVDSAMTLQTPARVVALMPHMHFRGKSFEMHAVRPGGRKQTLLRVPRYDFNWQLSYGLATPLALPAGTRIECIGYFDNSANNRFNPDPKSAVTWGDQTWEEMMIGWLWVAVDAKGPQGLLPSGE